MYLSRRMKGWIALVVSVLAIMLAQPPSVNSITDIDDKCVKQAYKIGYNISETYENKMNASTQLEADCIYSGKMSLEVRCLVWYYDIGIRVANSMLAPLNSTDHADYFVENDLINHECTNLDLL